MTDNPLTKWERTARAVQPAPRHEPEVESRSLSGELPGYKGEAGKDRSGGWLELRPLKGPWSLCAYAQLRKIQFNGAKPTRIDLIFTFEIVSVKGSNLEFLLTGLRSRTLALIEAFNPDIQERPAADALLVESIETGSTIAA